MRSVIFLSCILIFSFCSRTKNNNVDYDLFKLTQINLEDSLGSVSLLIPNRYDTFAQWLGKYGDIPGGKIKYRFQPKSIRFYLDSDINYTNAPWDSLDNLTIYHSHKITNGTNCTDEKFKDLHKESVLNENSKNPYNKNVVFDTIMNINGSIYSIIFSENYNKEKKQFYKLILANTEIKGNWITFENILHTRKSDSVNTNFFKDGFITIKSIKINHGI